MSSAINTTAEYQYGSDTDYEDTPDPDMVLDQNAEEGDLGKVAKKEDPDNRLIVAKDAMDQEVW